MDSTTLYEQGATVEYSAWTLLKQARSEKQAFAHSVAEALQKLPDRERQFIKRACGFGGFPAKNVEDLISNSCASDILRSLRYHSV